MEFNITKFDYECGNCGMTADTNETGFCEDCFIALGLDNACGKPHDGGEGEDQCAECMTIRLNI